MKPLVLLSWDGVSQPLRLLHRDASPAFDILLFDYSGSAAGPALQLDGLPCRLLSVRTECKGEIYSALARDLEERACEPPYVGLIDDDVMLSVSGINLALHIARSLELDSFSPSLSHDSNYSHRFTLSRPQRLAHPVHWVEVMMPFYRGSLFLAGAAHYEGNVSSWGIDQYLMPTLGALMKMERVAIIDAVMASHQREITSGGKVYRNGRTAEQEKQALRERCMALVAERAPSLVGTAWYRRTFLRRHAGSPIERLSTGVARKLRGWIDAGF